MKQITGLNDTLKFGKYKGKTVQYVLDNDRSYLHWIIEQNILLFNNEVVGLLLVKDVKQFEEFNEPSWEDMNPDWGLRNDD